ncbi:hypothetical protein FSP39_000557 [Pinctada imbricata]|uniref:Disease resistance R13L4/SHOC-2-like LRR domain-containing protein n=1 Tax=Pinctada imbricata TaxID=66713 RepID=A0AA88YP48_PINIB|nr:hypothetical protein FSP39_000557 [Pinctada imbricata]
MGNVETHDLAPVRDDERKELNLARRITYRQYKRHINGEFHEACLTEIPWNIRDSISLYERMTVAFNAITEIPPELPLRIPHLNYLDLSHNQIENLPESFGLQFHLKTLIARNNKLRSLPVSFVHLVKLEKIDLSNNLLKDLPEDIGNMESIQKLNVSDNKLKTLPLSLGSSDSIKMVLAVNNRLQDPSQSICDEGSEETLNYLRKRFRSVHKGTVTTRPSTPLNEFPRVRGNQLHSSVPNPHSAHVQYIQSQTHTTNTPSRIKTPLMPPLEASVLDPDVLRDRVVGLLYGAAIGDAIGLATRGMSADECRFHYDEDFITYKDVVQDERRVRWRQGDWTSNFDLMVLVLDSLIAWAGVIDELDFAKRLQNWCKSGFPELGDNEGIILSQTIQKVTSHKQFVSNPHYVAKELEGKSQADYVLENGGITSDEDKGSVSSNSSLSGPAWKEYKAFLRTCSRGSLSSGCEGLGLDNGAIVRTAVLGVPSFHNLPEVVNNTVRICKATHTTGLAVGSSVVISVLIALLLQGKHDVQTTKGLEEMIIQARDLGREFLSSTEEKADFEYYCSLQDLKRLDVNEFGKMGYCLKPLGAAIIGLRSKLDFRSFIMKLILNAGDSNSNACVAGAILGCKYGFSHLPKQWISELRTKQTKWLNVKINLLLDMMGLP